MKIKKIFASMTIIAILGNVMTGCASEEGIKNDISEVLNVENRNELSAETSEMTDESTAAEEMTLAATEEVTVPPTEPPAEPFPTESAYYIGVDMDNILSGGYMVEDAQYIYFVDTNKATVWGSDEVQKSGHICKYDKTNKVCEDLTSASWSEVFFSPLNNDPLKSLSLSQDGYLYALTYNENIGGYSIVRIQTETGDIAPFHVSEYSIDSMILVENHLIYTTTAGGIYSLNTVSGESIAIADTETDSTEETQYINYTIVGVFGDSLYYAYNIVTGESADDYSMKMELVQYSLDTGEKKILAIKDESGADCSAYFDSQHLCVIDTSILTMRSSNAYLFHLDTRSAEPIGNLYDKMGVSDGWYPSGKIHLGDGMYFYDMDDSGMNIIRLSDDFSDGGIFYTVGSMYTDGNGDLNLLSMYSFGKAENRIVLAAQERMIFISEDGTEEILEFED